LSRKVIKTYLIFFIYFLFITFILLIHSILDNNSQTEFTEITISFEGINPLELYGEGDSKLKIVKRVYPEVKIINRGDTLRLVGKEDQVTEVKEKIELMISIIKQRQDLSVQTIIDLLNGNNPLANKITDSHPNNVIVYGKEGKPIKAKTINQKKLVEASKNNDIVFAIGPAGTGKTYVAVAMAVAALKNKTVKKIILTRPAVEAGESLGFLPGDLKEKVDPYLRPLYDALEDLFPMDKLKFFMENNTIEVAPLAFMRGRTLDNSFIILDEAQNCTSPQLKMFLTRLGPNAKCIITGDMTQIDLPPSQSSGLQRALHLLDNINGIGIIHLNEEDVVRHRLVKEIIKRYNESDERIKLEKEAKKAERIAAAELRREEIQDKMDNSENHHS
jgi:phosphate starvation-inducible protein PhoH and related proteins